MADAAARIEAMLSTLYHPELKSIDLSLGRIKRLLAALEHPERKLPPIVHVAGTNGKGSLVAYLQAIAQSSGLRAHRYISPHLVRFNERIVLAGKEIDDDTLWGYLQRVHALAQECPATFFEATTAAAFLAFADVPADVLLLEVGVGGRLDATNVVEPGLTAITPVSLDHKEYLGDTLTKIAYEKAGILKPGVPAVIGPQEPEALAEITRVAKLRGAPLFIHGRDWRVEGDEYVSARMRVKLAPSLPGAHQLPNAATAAACAEMFFLSPPTGRGRIKVGGKSIHLLRILKGRRDPHPGPPPFRGRENIERGITAAVWPARLQRMEDLAPGIECWLDGGHNAAAGEALAAWTAGVPLALVVGMIKTKDSAEFLKPLAAQALGIVTVPIPDEPLARTAEELRDIAAALHPHVTAAPDMAQALTAAKASLPGKGRVLICGSLYLAGKVLAGNA